MISTVLSEAIEQIKRYRLEFDTFPADWPEMDDLVSRMEQMRAKLDSTDKIDEPENYVRPITNEIPMDATPDPKRVTHAGSTVRPDE